MGQQTEKVTVTTNVACTITIGNFASAEGVTSFTAYIPYGKQYSAYAYANGYHVVSGSQSYTASQPTRDISIQLSAYAYVAITNNAGETVTGTVYARPSSSSYYASDFNFSVDPGDTEWVDISSCIGGIFSSIQINSQLLYGEGYRQFGSYQQLTYDGSISAGDVFEYTIESWD